MSSVFSEQGNGVNSIFVMNKSLSMRALRLDTKNSTDYFFPFSPSPQPHPYEVDAGVYCGYSVYEEVLIYIMIASLWTKLLRIVRTGPKFEIRNLEH